MKTLRKVGEILRCFSATQPEHNVSSLARRIGNSVSGTHDLVAGLSQIGLLQKVDRGRYRLGPLVASLHRALEDSSALTEAARPVMDSLRSEYGETLHLTQHDHGRLLVLSALEGQRNLRVSTDIIGTQIELHDCPPGLLHLSALIHSRLETYLDRHSSPGGGIESRSRFRTDLANLAEAGFAVGTIRGEDDVVCTAARILDHIGQSIAVLSLAIPKSRHDQQPRAFRTITIEAAQKISRRLGYAEV